jgi:hypothetical protein
MKKSEIEVGKTYIAKVSGKLVPVRIIEESQYGGWSAINTASHRAIHIRGAQRLRSECKPTRCGTCDNCRTAIADRAVWADKYRAAIGSDEKEFFQNAWKIRSAQIPCTSHKSP